MKRFLNDSKLYYNSRLFERYGIVKYDDKQYQNDLKEIEYDLLTVIIGKSDRYTEVDFDLPDYGSLGTFKLIKFENKCNISELLILLQQDYRNNLDCILLSNDAAKKNKFYVKNGQQILRATILITYKNYRDFENNRLAGLIEHELKHLFDQNKKYNDDSFKMNKDVVLLDSEFYDFINTEAIKTFHTNIEDSIASTVKLSKINDVYLSVYYDNCTLILPFIADMLYYLNESEISARLTQIKWKDDMSKTRDLYQQFYKLCENIIKYADYNVKEYLNNIINKFNFSEIYNIKFGNDINKNVQKLLNLYMKRIHHFIKQCDKLIYDNKLLEDAFIGLNRKPQNYLHKLKYNYLYPTLHL